MRGVLVADLGFVVDFGLEDGNAQVMGDDVAKRERERAAEIINARYFDALLAVETDGEEVGERLSEAINGAVRDILGEYAPPELFDHPGALKEAVARLGIKRELRKLPNGTHEERWVCATCKRAGDWTATRDVIASGAWPIEHLHAREHTVSTGS